jgi:hypothetical protein
VLATKIIGILGGECMIQIIKYTVKEFASVLDCTEAEVIEWYGEDVVALYIAQRGAEESAFAGVMHKDGSYSVYGLRQDEDNITYEHMVTVMSRGF